MVTVLIGDVFGVKRIGAIMGVISASWSLGAAIGPALGGSTYDARGSTSFNRNYSCSARPKKENPIFMRQL
jgi:MFS family permease